MMTLEDSFQNICMHMKNRKPAASHIIMSTMFHKRKTIQEYSD